MPDDIIHAAKIRERGRTRYLFLRKLTTHQYAWFDGPKELEIKGDTITHAIEEGRKYWKLSSFQTLECGFRFSLPERDEIGTNALFCQMVQSYSSFNGHYFDDEVGHNCIVKEASQESLNLWKKGSNG